MDDKTAVDVLYIVERYAQRRIGELDGIIAKRDLEPAELRYRATFTNLLDAIEQVRGTCSLEEEDEGLLWREDDLENKVTYR